VIGSAEPLPSPADLERNLRLISLHELLVRTSPWIAVFVLFTRSRFDLEGAIQLAGIYYLSVVVFEVPSGWASDRLGRVVTLRAVGLIWIGCFTCYLVGDDVFWVIAAGQVLLALGYASLSGTDVSFHYDTLEALGREDEYSVRQARVSSRGLFVGASGVLAGGALGLIDLRLAFALSLILAIMQFLVTLRFVEPSGASEAPDLLRQVGTCLSYLRTVPLGWVFGYGVAMVVLEHVAFTLLQPWMTQTLGQTADDLGSTPLLVGVTMAVVAVVGSVFAASTVPLSERFGVSGTLVGLGALSAIIVTAMAVWQHPAVLPLVALRSAQGAAAPILISAVVSPRVQQHHRATVLSLNSLGGRMLWGSLLLVVSVDAGDDVAGTLTTLAAISWVLVLTVAIWARQTERNHGPITP
jgi:MFS family permease